MTLFPTIPAGLVDVEEENVLVEPVGTEIRNGL